LSAAGKINEPDAFNSSFTQPVRIALVVFFSEEAGFAIVSALHDVQGEVIELDTWAAGHG
jgi:hypothetical protein